jgi:4-alpha-glucanotransferase
MGKKLSSDRKLAGLLEPVFAIRTEGDLGVGDTDGVRQMIDWCHDHGLNIFQTLPLNETSGDNSPYNAISSLAIDPTTLAVSPEFLPDLTEQKFYKIARPALLRSLRRGPVNYSKIKALKRALLQAAFDHFHKVHLDAGTDRAVEFLGFVSENTGWLPDYALFRLLLEENSGQTDWQRWPKEHQTPAAANEWMQSLPGKRRSALARQQQYFMYVQWVAFGQWEALKKYGEGKKVFLMGDIPFGVSRHSADVWANRELFDLEWSGGAPPERFFKVDKFTERWGQNWGIADFRWDEMRRQNFAWWRRRVAMVRKSFHLTRVDHAPGFYRIFSFPWAPERNADFVDLNVTEAAVKTGGLLPCFKPHADDTPDNKLANLRHGEETLRAVLEAAGDTVVVAEDLGLVPEYMPGSLMKLGIPGYRIPNFFREQRGSYVDSRLYPRLSLAQPATHDHPPLAAAWAEHWRNIDADNNIADNRRELRWMMEFAGLGAEETPRTFTDELREGFLRAVLQSNSWLVVAMITDVMGQLTRFNTPGLQASGNWSQRMPRTVREMRKDRVWAGRMETYARLAAEAGRGFKPS